MVGKIMQKFKPLFLTYIIFFLLHTCQAFANKTDFHRAETGPEKALNNILIFYLDNKDYSVMYYLLKAPKGYDNAKKMHVYENPPEKIKEKISQMFSKSFMDRLAVAQAKFVKKFCNNEYPIDETCSPGYSPIVCGPDYPDEGALYRTISSSNTSAIIESAWHMNNNFRPIARYKLVKNASDLWAIDEIWCAPTDFHDWDTLDKQWGG